jgi:hypothetical protein
MIEIVNGIMRRTVSAGQMAKSLCGTLSGGINWAWAHFDNEKTAIMFDEWCGRNFYETRGVYSPSNNDNNWSVRYR